MASHNAPFGAMPSPEIVGLVPDPSPPLPPQRPSLVPQAPAAPGAPTAAPAVAPVAAPALVPAAAPSQPRPRASRDPRRKTKPEWELFIDRGLFDGAKDPFVRAAECKYCAKVLRGKIETMATHIGKCPEMQSISLRAYNNCPDKYVKRSHKKGEATIAKARAMQAAVGRTPAAAMAKVDQAALEQQLVRWQISSNLPFDALLDPELIKVLKMLNPAVKVPSQANLSRLYLAMQGEKA